MKRHSNSRKGAATSAGSRGYTLLELMVSLFILAVLTGTIFEQINRIQRKSGSEAVKLDLTQQAREFVSQTVRDLHMSGYPNASMYSNPPAGSNLVAAGLVSASPTQILFEGDVNSDGTVSSVNIYYVPSDPTDPNCPCIRRGAVIKIPGDSLHQPVSPTYTETGNVFPPGTGGGQSGEDLFTYYKQNGDPVDVGSGVDISSPEGVATISQIKTVKINLSLLTSLRDPVTNGLIRTTISATARLNQ